MTHAPQQEIADHALGVLAAFLPDYTDPDDDGHRARVVVVGGSAAEGYFDVEVIRVPRSGGSPRFRVSLNISLAPIETTDEASDRGGMSSRDEPGMVRPVSRAGHRA